MQSRAPILQHTRCIKNKKVNLSFLHLLLLSRFKSASRHANSLFQSVLSFVIVAKMELGFQLAVIALGLSVTAAGFLYFFYDANLYRGLKDDQPEERAFDNHSQ